jgi:hypothetical protein
LLTLITCATTCATTCALGEVHCLLSAAILAQGTGASILDCGPGQGLLTNSPFLSPRSVAVSDSWQGCLQLTILG